jgi:hypothetical protein
MVGQVTLQEPVQTELRAGILNMLCHCAGLENGQSLLILIEPAGYDHYDPGLAPAVAKVARDIGLRVSVQELAPCPMATAPAPEVMQAIAHADLALFLTRRGDQLRFDPVLGQTAPVMCYALDRAMMGSRFGQADHRGFMELLACLNAALAQARHLHVTCPLGTDFQGPGACFPKTGGEVTVRRFPLSVFSPVPAAGYAGQIAVAGFLTGTGRSRYIPYHLPLSDVLRIRFDGTSITGFDGPDAPAARAHYDHVGALLGTAAQHVHSWHAGIHPGCAFRTLAGANVERWGSGAFGNPRVLHFHTCGTVAPGEISLNVIDPTIRLDGVPVWEAGRLFPERMAGGSEVLTRHDGMAALFANPETEIGLAASGLLAM